MLTGQPGQSVNDRTLAFSAEADKDQVDSYKREKVALYLSNFITNYQLLCAALRPHSPVRKFLCLLWRFLLGKLMYIMSRMKVKSSTSMIYNSANLLCQGAWLTAKTHRGERADTVEHFANIVMPGTGVLLKTLLK